MLLDRGEAIFIIVLANLSNKALRNPPDWIILGIRA